MAPASAWSDDPSPVAVLERQRRRESAARTYARSFPIVPVRAHGMTIEGAAGRQCLDCLSGSGTPAPGHNHLVVVHFCGPAGTDAVEAAGSSAARSHHRGKART